MYKSAVTLDDLMRDVVTLLDSDGQPVQTSRGRCCEVTGVLLELTNPRARLSSTETRGKLFSALGEFCWYIAASNDVAFVSHYIPEYSRITKGCTRPDAYGPRFFGPDINQIENVIQLLRQKPTSRKGTIQILRASDLSEHLRDNQTEMPCTSTIQFFLRDNKVTAMTTMRSNDAFKGIVHDVFAFTMLQEILARSLGVEPGTYKHVVGSLHLYDTDKEKLRRFCDEGWQGTSAMPEMPPGDPWPQIRMFIDAEAEIRTTKNLSEESSDNLDPYWRDLSLLLLAYTNKSDASTIRKIRGRVNGIYEPYLNGLLARI